MSLLAMMNWLDRDLEDLLTEKSKTEITLVSNERSDGDETGVRELSTYYGERRDAELKVSSGSSSEGLSDEEDEVKQEVTDVKHAGTQVRFPDCTLSGASLLKCVGLSLVVKCGRCKGGVDMKNVSSTTQWVACQNVSFTIILFFSVKLNWDVNFEETSCIKTQHLLDFWIYQSVPLLIFYHQRFNLHAPTVHTKTHLDFF